MIVDGQSCTCLSFTVLRKDVSMVSKNLKRYKCMSNTTTITTLITGMFTWERRKKNPMVASAKLGVQNLVETHPEASRLQE